MSLRSQCSVVIVHWNSVSVLQAQLAVLATFIDDIIVVDNNSTAFDKKILADFPSVRLVQNPYNRGFGAACNQGAVLAKHHWLLFLNPDATVTEENLADWLEKMQEAGLVASSPVSESNYMKPVPTPLSLLVEFSPVGKILPLHIFGSPTLVGGLLLIQTTVFRSIGGYDERFFMWFEDSDLTRRLLDQKHAIGRLPIPVTHQGGGSVKQLSQKLHRQLFFTSMRVYARKHFCFFGRKIVEIVARRFDSSQLLPTCNPELISVVVPNIRAELLNAFVQQIPTTEASTEYMVVTTSLGVDELWRYRAKWPLVRWIILEKPLGFASTVNIGLRAAAGSYCGTVNDDVSFPSQVFTELRATAEKSQKKAGSINPAILNSDDLIESIGVSVLPKGKALVNEGGGLYSEYLAKNPAKILEVNATNAACVLYSKEALEAAGIFDERFGSYLEDIDLSLRLDRKGYLNLVVPYISILHQKHQTTKTFGKYKHYLDWKNWMLLIAKNWSLQSFVRHLPSIMLERLRNTWALIK